MPRRAARAPGERAPTRSSVAGRSNGARNVSRPSRFATSSRTTLRSRRARSTRQRRCRIQTTSPGSRHARCAPFCHSSRGATAEIAMTRAGSGRISRVSAAVAYRKGDARLRPKRSDANLQIRRAEMGVGVVPELGDERMPLECGLHDGALHARPRPWTMPQFARGRLRAPRGRIRRPRTGSSRGANVCRSSSGSIGSVGFSHRDVFVLASPSW